MPISVPSTVNVEVTDSWVTVSGPRGALSHSLPDGIRVRREEDWLIVERRSEERQHRSLHGLTRSLVNNMVMGVTEGFEKRLEIVGVGYRALPTDKGLTISVGYSHPVVFDAPEGVALSVEGPRVIVSGNDKQLVGEIAARIRRIRPPEPYKGKGIRYLGEAVRRKVGKAGAKKR